MFKQMKKQVKELQEEVQKEIDNLWEISTFLNSVKNVVEYANKSV